MKTHADGLNENMNVSAVLHEKLNLTFEQKPLSEIQPSDGEVLLELRWCGICGTDMHAYTEGLDPRYVTLPVVLGHEASAVVKELGHGVTNLKQGDRVAVELGIPCRKCSLCKAGKYNLCKPWSFGGLQRYLCYAADFCHKIPDNMSLEEAALIEPLAVGVRAARRACVQLGSDVLVCGAGAIGLSALLAAKSAGASRICVTDVSEFRLQFATKMGATHTVRVTPKESGRKIADNVIKCLSSGAEGEPYLGVHHTIECSGVESSLQAAIYATRAGGVMAPVALDPPDVTLPIVSAATREIDIRGVFSYCNDYPSAIAMVSTGRADASRMITHRFPLQQLTDAIELIRSRQEGVLKVLIQCDA